MSESEHRNHRRPAFFSPSALEAHGPAYDPTEQIHVAHETALALVHAGRAAADPAVTQKLDVGASVFIHDGIVTVDDIPDSSFTNTAFDVDAQWGKVGDEGLYVLAEYLEGDNNSAAKLKMRGMQGLAAYNIRSNSPTAWLYAIEPFARLDLADPDTDTDDNGATVITAGIGIYMSSKAWFRIAYERQDFQAEGLEDISGVRSMLAVSF